MFLLTGPDPPASRERGEHPEGWQETSVLPQRSRQNVPLLEALGDALDEDDDTTPCAVCAL